MSKRATADSRHFSLASSTRSSRRFANGGNPLDGSNPVPGLSSPILTLLPSLSHSHSTGYADYGAIAKNNHLVANAGPCVVRGNCGLQLMQAEFAGRRNG